MCNYKWKTNKHIKTTLLEKAKRKTEVRKRNERGCQYAYERVQTTNDNTEGGAGAPPRCTRVFLLDRKPSRKIGFEQETEQGKEGGYACAQSLPV